MASHGTGWRSRLAAALLAVFALAGLTSIDARAVLLGGRLGALSGPGACVRDVSRGGVAAQRCGPALTGIQGASGLAVSPDGRNVYVAAAGSDAVVTLVRGSEGRLHPPLRPSRRSCVQASGGGDCAATTPGLGGAETVIVSRDGRFAYTGSLDSAAVVAFSRGRDGLLAPLRLPPPKPARKGKKKPKAPGDSCVQGNALAGAGGGYCPARAPALDAVQALGMSTDGRFLYAVSSGNQPGEDSIVTLHRDGRSGAISPLDCVSSLGTSRCRRQVAGLRGASSIAFSPDGRFAYVASQLSSAVVAFQRNRFTGALLPLPGPAACAGDPALPLPRGERPCPTAAAGLRGARALAMSSDGRFLYVAGFDPGSLTVLARDATSGALSPLAGVCMQAGPGDDCRPDVAALHGAAALALSRDGNTLYLAAQGDDAALAIPLSGGIPQPPPALGRSTGTLGGPQALALTPDGRTLYLASPIDDEVAALRAE